MKKKAPAGKVPATPPIPRGDRGYFAKGNPGKVKGTISWEKRALADACRELFEEHCPDQILSLLKQSEDLSVKLRTIEWLADRAYGKAPLIVRASLDPDSPEGVLLALAGQHLPGSQETTS